ncbi:MAG: oxidoreductase [Planctomycetaceae bacterium]|nr:oxidoreductase [Planctomycetaceae bacterium]
MSTPRSRRRFFQDATTGLAGGLLAQVALAADGGAAGSTAGADVLLPPAQREPLRFGYVGTGIRFHELVSAGGAHGPAVAVCDVDAVQRGRGLESALRVHRGRGYSQAIYDYEDYRRLLERDDVDVVVIATPDHWHTKIAIEAMQAGKDVYCEKPLTLTIREGQQILQAIKQTGRILQVGTQQRSEFDKRFVDAAALVRNDRVGDVQKITVAIGGSMTSPPLPYRDPPKELNWDVWQGQARELPYCSNDEIQGEGYGAGHRLSRTHNYFRWWYEYSGGKLTDWGAHHVDIAMWATQKDRGPVGNITIEPISVTHPVPFDAAGMPTVDNQFNAATAFHVRCTFDDGMVLDVRDTARDLGFVNGIMFEGSGGRLFVNRGKLTGKPVEELAQNPLPADAHRQLYGKEPPQSQMGDFVQCVRTRETPVSDAASHHRILSVCHAVNIAMRLGRTLVYDTAAEQFVDDAQANGFVERTQRSGYEIRV